MVHNIHQPQYDIHQPQCHGCSNLLSVSSHVPGSPREPAKPSTTATYYSAPDTRKLMVNAALKISRYEMCTAKNLSEMQSEM